MSTSCGFVSNSFVTGADVVKLRYDISRPMNISTWYINIHNIVNKDRFLEERGKEELSKTYLCIAYNIFDMYNDIKT